MLGKPPRRRPSAAATRKYAVLLKRSDVHRKRGRISNVPQVSKTLSANRLSQSRMSMIMRKRALRICIYSKHVVSGHPIRLILSYHSTRVALGEIPGLDPEKVLDIIIMVLQDKANGRPCNIKNFRKTVSKCIDLKGQSKDASGTSKILPSGEVFYCLFFVHSLILSRSR